MQIFLYPYSKQLEHDLFLLNIQLLQCHWVGLFLKFQDLKSHPNIFDCLVVGVKDDTWGQKVVAVIQRREVIDITVEEIKESASKYIASYKMPKEILFSDLIERAPSGKPNYQWAQNFANSKLNIK